MYLGKPDGRLKYYSSNRIWRAFEVLDGYFSLRLYSLSKIFEVLDGRLRYCSLRLYSFEVLDGRVRY